MRDQIFNDNSINRTIEAMLEQVQFRTSARRATAEYRRHIIAGLFRDTLEAAWERAELD
jgi:CO/xanthine dehydrogenase FAD-binding subunit